MTGREHLDKYKLIKARIRVLQAEIERLRTEAESMGVSLDGMPRGSGAPDKTARLAVQLAECEEVLSNELSGLWSMRMEIINNLGRLKDPKHQRLLHLRYIGGERWEQIAADLGVSLRWCYSLHDAALIEYEKCNKF